METKQRLIKRYPNRKLYDTEKSTYITLEEIGEMVKQGEDLRIIDNKTKEDLTSVILTQVIFETGKKNKSFLPLQTLKDLIQSGEESLQDFIQKTITNPVSSFKEEAGKKAKKIMAFYGEITELKKTLLHLEGRVLELERRSKNNRD